MGVHRAIALAGGVPQTPFFIRASPCGGYPQTPSEGQPSDFSINPNPFFIRRGFEPLSKPLANPWQGDVIDYGQRPPFVKGFLYGSQSLCPFGASHGLFTSLLSPPLEKGLISPTTLYDRGYHQTTSQGVALLSSINPNPFFIRRGFEPLPKPLANPWQGDVIDYGQRPPSVKGFLYGSQSLCPFGASHVFYIPAFAAP